MVPRCRQSWMMLTGVMLGSTNLNLTNVKPVFHQKTRSRWVTTWGKRRHTTRKPHALRELKANVTRCNHIPLQYVACVNPQHKQVGLPQHMHILGFLLGYWPPYPIGNSISLWNQVRDLISHMYQFHPA